MAITQRSTRVLGLCDRDRVTAKEFVENGVIENVADKSGQFDCG